MKPCFIHCGPHKTGSTSIQRSLEANAALLESRGLFVPNVSGAKSATKSHLQLIADLPRLDGQNLAAAPHWDRLRQIITTTDLVPILSSEIFSTHFMKPSRLRQVIALLRATGHRPHFIYYVRDHPAWMNSIYVQATKRFYTAQSFEAFVETGFFKPRFDYQLMLRHVLAENGADLAVLPFEPSASAGLFGSFLNVLGLGSLAGVQEVGRENPNAGVKSVYVGRKVAALLADRRLNPRAHRNLFVHLKKTYMRRGWHKEPYQGLDMDLAARISRRYQAANDSLAQAVWGRPWAEVIPPRTDFRMTEYRPEARWIWDRLDVEKTLKQLRGMIAAIPDAPGEDHAQDLFRPLRPAQDRIDQHPAQP